MSPKPEKPLGYKAYGSIPHLPGSRRGPADKGLSESHAAILTTKTRDKHDLIIVEEKLDGSCVSVANIGGQIIPLIRAGYAAKDSRYGLHHDFYEWVMSDATSFLDVLAPGDRMVGEWLGTAHGTRYVLRHEPFVVFDVICGKDRLSVENRNRVVANAGLPVPHLLHCAHAPFSIENAMSALGEFGHHGAQDPCEGAVWRCERRGQFDFVGKYVRHGKVDGCYLPEKSGRDAIFNFIQHP